MQANEDVWMHVNIDFTIIHVKTQGMHACKLSLLTVAFYYLAMAKIKTAWARPTAIKKSFLWSYYYH